MKAISIFCLIPLAFAANNAVASVSASSAEYESTVSLSIDWGLRYHYWHGFWDSKTGRSFSYAHWGTIREELAYWKIGEHAASFVELYCSAPSLDEKNELKLIQSIISERDAEQRLDVALSHSALPETFWNHSLFDHENTREQIKGKIACLIQSHRFFEANMAICLWWPVLPRMATRFSHGLEKEFQRCLIQTVFAKLDRAELYKQTAREYWNKRFSPECSRSPSLDLLISDSVYHREAIPPEAAYCLLSLHLMKQEGTLPDDMMAALESLERKHPDLFLHPEKYPIWKQAYIDKITVLLDSPSYSRHAFNAADYAMFLLYQVGWTFSEAERAVLKEKYIHALRNQGLDLPSV